MVLSFFAPLLAFVSLHSVWAVDPFIRLKEVDLTPTRELVQLDEYLVANERFPEDALKAYQAAPEGVYISVGTERGFIGAANGGRVSHLLLVDINPNVTIYNRVNISLLKMASDREDYLRLRQERDPEVWLQRARQVGLSEDETARLGSFHQRWKSLSYQNSSTESHEPGIEVANPVKNRGFNGVNYLFEDALFMRLKKMADEGKIVAAQGDWGDDSRMEEIVVALKDAGVKISVVDISNAWWGRYIPEQRLARTLKTLDYMAQAKSLVIATEGYPMLNHFLGDRLMWTYSAYTYERIRQNQDWRDFVRSMYNSRIAPFYWKLRIFGWQLPGAGCSTLLK
ncbi:MAG: hypothetical protein JNL01_13525 [Bdellovibrionales bacterium]|nr:hypothetical protein [Bdellovibrionales bacterium]